MLSRVGLALATALLLLGCGAPSDDGAEDDQGADRTGPTTARSSPPAPAPTTSEASVEPATGRWLDTGYAKVRAPEGWRLEDNFGFERVQQAFTEAPYPGSIHFALYQRPPSVRSVADVARFAARELRTRLEMGRFTVGEQVAIGGATATELVGEDRPLRVLTAYAVMVGDLRWTILFDLGAALPEDERRDLIASVLDTWEFVPPS